MHLRPYHFVFLAALAMNGSARADGADPHTGPLGKVSFATSCDPKVQPEFERGVAMLHSFWYSAAERALSRTSSRRDPQCAIAAWGYASILMANPLAGQGASKEGAATGDRRAREGQGAPARRPNASGPHRRRLGLFADWADGARAGARRSRTPRRIDGARGRASRDDEAQIFSALFNAGTQTLSDQTYAK